MSQYWTTVKDVVFGTDDPTPTLCMFVVEHGAFVYTGHINEDGVKWWYYQGPCRTLEVFKDFWDELNPPPLKEWATVEPTVNEAEQIHNFDWSKSKVIRRPYESLKSLYEQALERIAELENQLSHQNITE